MKFTPAEPDSGTILVRPGQRDDQQTVFYFQLWSALLVCKIALFPISFYPSFILPPLQDHHNCSEGPSSPWQSPSILDSRLPCRERREGAGERVVTYDTSLQTCSHTDAAKWAGTWCVTARALLCHSQPLSVTPPLGWLHVGNSHFTSVPQCCWVTVVFFLMNTTKSTRVLKLASRLAESSQQFQMKKTKQASKVL